MSENEILVFIRCLTACTGFGWIIGISFGIAILMISSILDIFKETSK